MIGIKSLRIYCTCETREKGETEDKEGVKLSKLVGGEREVRSNYILNMHTLFTI